MVVAAHERGGRCQSALGRRTPGMCSLICTTTAPRSSPAAQLGTPTSSLPILKTANETPSTARLRASSLFLSSFLLRLAPIPSSYTRVPSLTCWTACLLGYSDRRARSYPRLVGLQHVADNEEGADPVRGQMDLGARFQDRIRPPRAVLTFGHGVDDDVVSLSVNDVDGCAASTFLGRLHRACVHGPKLPLRLNLCAPQWAEA